MTDIRTDWTRPEIAALFELPFTELVFRAATILPPCARCMTGLSST